MARYRTALPQLSDELFLAYVGMETDLIFTQGIDLPGFASYPLLESSEGRQRLDGYLRDLISVAKDNDTGVILETPTWVANRDRGAPLGYGPAQLTDLNRQAVEQLRKARDAYGDLPTVISANLGPRDDAYAPADQMTATEAERYHSEQIEVLAETDVDVVSAYTLAYPEEAIGIVKAAKRYDLPVVVAFTVETDGRLPTGATLEDAITKVDLETEHYVTYFMINCAHPDHFSQVLEDKEWMARVKGIVSNASRCSHAELDEAEELDPGDPEELGQQLAALRTRFPHVSVLGGCCGTDMRHIRSICEAVRTS